MLLIISPFIITPTIITTMSESASAPASDNKSSDMHETHDNHDHDNHDHEDSHAHEETSGEMSESAPDNKSSDMHETHDNHDHDNHDHEDSHAHEEINGEMSESAPDNKSSDMHETHDNHDHDNHDHEDSHAHEETSGDIHEGHDNHDHEAFHAHEEISGEIIESLAEVILPLLAGVGVAVVAGALGCFVVWRRMAYFGDAMAHSALLGVALGLLTGIGTSAGAGLICLVFAVLLTWLRQKHTLTSDILLGILAHSALAIGIVAMSLFHEESLDLHSLLFGDILSVNSDDLWRVYGGGGVVLALLIWNWRALTLVSIHEDLAATEGVSPFRINLLLVILMAATVAISMRIIGVLLITSLLIIPAATAHLFARSTLSMAFSSSALGVIGVILGLASAAYLQTPTPPTIVVVLTLLFASTFALSQKKQ